MYKPRLNPEPSSPQHGAGQEQYIREARDRFLAAGIRLKLNRGYRIDELEVFSVENGTLPYVRVHIAHEQHPFVLWCRRVWRKHVVNYKHDANAHREEE